ncbi:maleate cis-trans isomerase family protein [Sulfitobacter sp. JB4-11]|uniref:maleate cis-trans isomerase family protein n=1 Tax=Sulfitobacter rhodophyticola TaxID=3238304 RepID=UPI003516F3D3
MGLIVLQTDETLEGDMRRVLRDDPTPLYVSRIPSAPQVSSETLGAMSGDLKTAAGLLPDARPYRVVGYGCTSASAVIGSEKVQQIVQTACDVAHVTNPLRATIACAADLGISKLALVSPYVEEVNVPLRAAFAQAGLSTDAFGSFQEAEEAKVVRISAASLLEAGRRLGADSAVEGVFLSCTNLRTLDVIPRLSEALGKPVLSSNQALAWHMMRLNMHEC